MRYCDDEMFSLVDLNMALEPCATLILMFKKLRLTHDNG